MGKRAVVGFTHRAEYDKEFMNDIQLLCSLLGIEDLIIIPVGKEKGDYASNVRGYGDILWELIPFDRYDCMLVLSWRFRNDRDFRLKEAPKLMAAMAKALEK